LLRALLHRLGLTPDSPQLRIVATSASIDEGDPRSMTYLEQFFGRDPSSFRIIGGNRSAFPSAIRTPTAQAFVNFGQMLDAGTLATSVDELVTDAGVPASASTPERRLTEALAGTGVLENVRLAGAQNPFTSEDLGGALFGADPQAHAAARAVI